MKFTRLVPYSTGFAPPVSNYFIRLGVTLLIVFFYLLVLLLLFLYSNTTTTS